MVRTFKQAPSIEMKPTHTHLIILLVLYTLGSAFLSAADFRLASALSDHMVLQQEKPEDFVIATGLQYSVRQFIKWSAAKLGIKLRFKGQGVEEVAIITSITSEKAPALKPGQIIVRVDQRYFRPTEVETLLGDPTKAKTKLGWTPEITVQEMCSEMVTEDLQDALQRSFLESHG